MKKNLTRFVYGFMLLIATSCGKNGTTPDPAPAPEWGSMLSAGRAYIRDYSYMTLFPGIAIMLTVLSLNLIGDGLRDALDPKLKR